MGKQGKKKGGKKEVPKEQSSQGSVSLSEEPSTSAPPEEEEDVGLTGGGRKKKEKKEKKEKALQALQELQASRKPSTVATSSETTSETASRSQSEAPSEPTSRAQSEASSEAASKAPSEAPTAQPEPKVEEVAEQFEGLGLGGSRKKKPRKKKLDPTPPIMEGLVQPTPTTQASQDIRRSSTQVTSPRATPRSALGSGRGFAPGPAPVSAPGPAPVSAPGAATGFPPGSAPGFPPGSAPGFPPGSAPGFPPGSAPGFPPGSAPGFPPGSVSGFPPGSAPVLVQMPEPVTSAPPGPWGKGAPQSAGRGRGRAQFAPDAPAIRSFPVSSSQSLPQPSSSSQILIGSNPPQTVRPPATSSRSLEPVLCRYKIPTKIPGRSVRANHITVLVNYLPMQFKDLKISRYDVNFTPDRPKKMIPKVFQMVKQKYFPKELIAFDQMKNCYSLRPLPNVAAAQRFTTSVELLDQNNRTMTFEVAIKSTGIVDLGNIKRYMSSRGSSLCHPTEEVQCIDVILRQGALESYVKAGRQFFKRPANPVDLGLGYEMWTGLFQSAIFTDKAFINIDVAHKGFPKSQSMIDALRKDFHLDPGYPVDRQRGGEYFAAFVKGLKVVATLVGDTPSAGHRREFICNSLVGPPSELVFTITETDGRTRKTTVAEYFAKEKRYRLKYPNLNCLWVGSKDRCIYFPMELLDVAYGQALARQLNEMQVSKMVKEAATPPDTRLNKIKEVISNMKYSQNKDFKEFGLEISDKFYQVKAKVLMAPSLQIGNGVVQPRNGSWMANRLLKPEPLQSWGLIAVDTDPRNDYGQMISMIKSTGTGMGMSVADPKIVNVSARMTTLRSVLMNACKDVKFVFVIMSARGRDDYHRVKQMAEREVGILTQCIKEQTTRRMNPMTVKNILLKVNSKLMGINQAIESSNMPRCLKDGGVMIVGADVTHPSPDQANVPSIAAVTASMDPKCFIYNIELSVQTPKKEMIVEFEDMMFDHLSLYKERNQNLLPRKIFVFRDGVSEGQFAQVMNSELQAVHNAYQRMTGQAKKPEVLFLLVQKRHHTRLFCEGGRSTYNVEPGTVVDCDIVHASELDFYLVSHQAIKGTARPTRYHAVCNDGNIPDDEVEQLTYYLCHLYARCMRSVSYPTPTYYAHLACLRARSLTHGERFDNRELERKPKRLHVLDKMLEFSRMFFV